MKSRRDLSKEVKRIVEFYEALEIRLSKEEFEKALPGPTHMEEAFEVLEEIDYQLREDMGDRVEIWQEKWDRLIRLRKFFAMIPFVDFVFVAGSLALGNVHEYSDFDVIIGTKEDRLFTSRIFAVVLFEIFNLRRSKEHRKEEASDTVCLNHFVTPEAFELSGPYNIYWEQLYRRITPIYGNTEDIKDFLRENQWALPSLGIDEDYLRESKSFIARSLEFVLSGSIGDLIEGWLRKYQLKRIEKNKKKFTGKNPRLEYGKNELRFHMDTKRIKDIVDIVEN